MADKKQTWGSRHGDLSNEGLSLVENAAYLGQPIPDKLREILAQLHERSKKEAEAENNKAAQAQVKEMLTWVERYDKASVEAKHMIIAALVDRIEIGENYEVHIQFKVSAEQFIRQTA